MITQGKWKVLAVRNGFAISQAVPPPGGEACVPLCELLYRRDYDPGADSRLIRAAPELLQLVEGAVAMCGAIRKEGQVTDGTLSDFMKAASKVIRAIHKERKKYEKRTHSGRRGGGDAVDAAGTG